VVWWGVVNVGMAASYTFAILFGIRQKQLWVKPLMAGSAAGVGLLSLVLGGYMQHQGDPVALAVAHWVPGLFLFIGSCVFFKHEHYFLEILGIVALSLSICLLVADVTLDMSYPVELFHQRNVGFMLCLLSVGCMIYRRKTLRETQKEMREDERVYSCIWNKLIQDPLESRSLYSLSASVKSLGLDTFKQEARQTSVKWSGIRETNGTFTVSWWKQAMLTQSNAKMVLEHMKPIRSLDQLFKQAEGIDQILREKVMEWGSKSKGMMLYNHPLGNLNAEHAQQVQFISLAEVMGEPDKLKWAPLKRKERAIEKLYRCYQNDPSRLCDLARQMIVFKTVADLEACFKEICRCQEVNILRVKNSLDLAGTDSCLSGYRQLLINLQLETERTIKIGCALHVVEIQLLLLDFARIKNKEGHRRYVALRNARGE